MAINPLQSRANLDPIPANIFPGRRVSFVGNGFLVLVVVGMIFAGSAAFVAVYDVLANACSAGCPR